MKDYKPIFDSLRQELNEMMNEECMTDDDIRRQELKLKQINKQINDVGDELRREKLRLNKQRCTLTKNESDQLLN